VKLPRSSGVQLHLTSLPAGHLGQGARAWVDWLAEAGQTWWQVLPLGPPDRHRSPYKAHSAFAAWDGFLEDPRAAVAPEEEDAFRERHAFWIDGWEASAGAGAVAAQVRFDREWAALRAYAAQRGVRLIGDVPIYVAPGGADHRAWPELFQSGAVAGAPPDAFTAKGQHWGNPLYDWPALRRRGYTWWIERLRRTFDLVDLTRIDHFRGFVSYWAVPEDAPDASYGAWRRGPGRAVFAAAEGALGELAVIAEDLGVITPPVTRLRRELGFPGMAVLQFGFDPDDPHGPHRPENHTADRLVYTSTHDTDTVMGWWGGASADRRAAAVAAGVDPEALPWSFLELAWVSVCPVAMTSAQDVLGLGSEGRMNVPGRAGGAWRWRLQEGQLTREHARRLRELTRRAGRLAG
jgi:4-alpha-glucanotransferase